MSAVRRVVAFASVATVLFLAAAAGAFQFPSPGISPPGANDWSCRPTARHPDPVVLVHGTYGDMTVTWNVISPLLAAKGYCVFALDYGHRATGVIQDSARELRGFVNRVLAATGAAKVSIVGHSQGGMMPRYYIKFLGGDQVVDDMIGLAPSNHGTTTPLAAQAARYGSCPACAQQVAGSNFLQKLNAGDETPGDVSYTQIETTHDEIVTPYTSAFLPRGPRTTNVLLQDKCPLDPSEHIAIAFVDPIAAQWVVNALGRPGPANPRFDPAC